MQTLEATMTDMQEAVSNILETDDLHKIDMFIAELRSHGIEEVEQIEESYFGCFPSVEAFSENFIEDCYGDALDAMPTFLQNAVDFEMVWHQTLQYDFTEIYFDYEYYIFNRNF